MSLGRLRRNTCNYIGVRFNNKFINKVKQHKLSDVMFVVITITLLVVLDVLALSYFIYYCITVHHSILEIIFWAIVMFSTFGTFNLLGITMIKDMNNK